MLDPPSGQNGSEVRIGRFFLDRGNGVPPVRVSFFPGQTEVMGKIPTGNRLLEVKKLTDPPFQPARILESSAPKATGFSRNVVYFNEL